MTSSKPCGCYYSDIPWGPSDDEQGEIIYCPLHAAAPEMLEFIRECDELFNASNFTDRGGYGRTAKELIHRAEGRKL